MHKNYYRIDNPQFRVDIEDTVVEDWIMANNPKINFWILTPEQPNLNAVWQDGTWIMPSDPIYTAEQWVRQYFTSMEVIALMRLEQSILLQGKIVGPKMQATKQWLEGMMLEQPSTSFSPSPYNYSETSLEAINTLTNISI